MIEHSVERNRKTQRRIVGKTVQPLKRSAPARRQRRLLVFPEQSVADISPMSPAVHGGQGPYSRVEICNLPPPVMQARHRVEPGLWRRRSVHRERSIRHQWCSSLPAKTSAATCSYMRLARQSTQRNAVVPNRRLAGRARSGGLSQWMNGWTARYSGCRAASSRPRFVRGSILSAMVERLVLPRAPRWFRTIVAGGVSRPVQPACSAIDAHSGRERFRPSRSGRRRHS